MKNRILIQIIILLSSVLISRAQGADSVVLATIKVAHMHCNNDMPTIKKRLLNQEGIDEVSFSAIQGDVSVFSITFHSAITNIATIEQVIESTPACSDDRKKVYRVIKDASRKKRKHD